MNAGEVEFPPQSITKYQPDGATVYYVVHQCCDQFSDLLDANGNLIWHGRRGDQVFAVRVGRRGYLG